MRSGETTVTLPSRSGPMISGGHCSSAAPSTCTAPCVGPHTPTSARTSEVLPEPLGPMTPMASPAASVKLTLRTTAAWPSGGATATSRQQATGSRQCRPDGIHTYPGKHICQSTDAVARSNEAAPFRDCGFNRCQCARHHDRRSDHGPRRQLMSDHEVGAEARALPTAASSASSWIDWHKS